MRIRRLAIGFACAAVTGAATAWAGVDLATLDACVAAKVAERGNPDTCIDAAHEPCQSDATGTPSIGALCYVEARDTWAAGIAQTMDTLAQSAPAEIVEIARIEAKYDVLSALLQCDRMEELAIAAGKVTEEEILLQKTRCAATASGLAYVRLKWRASLLK